MQNRSTCLILAGLLSLPAFATEKQFDLDEALRGDIRSVILQHEHVFNPDFLKVDAFSCSANDEQSEAVCTGIYRIYYQDPFLYPTAPIGLGEFNIAFGLKNGQAAFVIEADVASQF